MVTIQLPLSSQHTAPLSPSHHPGRQVCSHLRYRSIFMNFNHLRCLVKGYTANKWQGIFRAIGSVRHPRIPHSTTGSFTPAPPRPRAASLQTFSHSANRQSPEATDLVAGRTLHHNSRSHGEGRNRQHCDNHPLRSGIAWLHAQHKTLLI